MSEQSAEGVEPIVLETRRRRSPAEKLAILSELKRPGAKVSAVARRHGLSANILFRWRREEAAGSVPAAGKAEGLMPVALVASRRTAKSETGLIEIELSSGQRIRVDGSFDSAALRRVIDILDAR
jgi:transposase